MHNVSLEINQLVKVNEYVAVVAGMFLGAEEIYIN